VVGLGILDVTCSRQKDSLTVHSVNLTNAIMIIYWWYDHGQSGLFSLASGSDTARVAAAIDTNIFFDLVSDHDQGNESKVLVADWLHLEVEPCMADEIYQEIGRRDDEAERRHCRERCNQFRLLAPSEARQNARAQIVDLLGEGRTAQGESYRAYLIKAAPAGVQVFLPRDEELLRRAEEFQEHAGRRRCAPPQPWSVFNAPGWIRFTPVHLARKSSSSVSRTSGRRRFTSSSTGGSSSFLSSADAWPPAGNDSSISALARCPTRKAVSASSSPPPPSSTLDLGPSTLPASRASSSPIRSFFFRRRPPRPREPAPPAWQVP
jgi:hypothetical protein